MTENQDLFLRAREVARMLGIGESTVWKWIHTKKDAGFPQPKKLDRMTVFLLSDVRRFQEAVVRLGN